MQIFKKRTQSTDTSDAALVMASLGGDRDAFCVVVTRYQGLLCSLAYSSIGDLKQSEDIAQEAFLEAWKKLDSLRDPEKLKSWLCGILRFKVSHHRRKEEKQPVKNAEEIEEQGEYLSDQPRVEDVAIQEQEQALLWQALEKIPETYREPLVLFYREQCSVAYVADELDLSEDVVKQRLSRGRKLLQKAMITFVEDTLTKSKPGTAFTLGVLVAINGIAPPAKAAALGAGTVKMGSFFKLASILVFLASFSGVVSAFFGLRASLDQSRTQRERRSAIRFTALFFGIAIIFVVGMFVLKYLALNNFGSAGVYAVISQLLVLGFIASYIILVIRMLNRTPRLRAQERLFHPEAFLSSGDQLDYKQREFKSRLSLFGIPLIHCRFGMTEANEGPAFGWLAGGDRAYGLLFAWGGVAIAPISVGIVAVGVLSVGALGFGLIGAGTVAIGFIGFGASAIAYKAYASLSALGWESAFSGGFSMAKEAAIGPLSFATQINNEHAAEISNLALLDQSYLWALTAIAVFVIAPSVWYSNKVRQRMRKNSDGNC